MYKHPFWTTRCTSSRLYSKPGTRSRPRLKNSVGNVEVCTVRTLCQYLLLIKSLVDSLFESLRSNSQDESNPFSPTSPRLDEGRDVDTPEYIQQNGKRTRKIPVLPAAAKHEFNTKRTVRERKKLQKRQEELDARKSHREQQMMREMYAHTHAQPPPPPPADFDFNDVEMRSKLYAFIVISFN